jgi:IS5 family transposase
MCGDQAYGGQREAIQAVAPRTLDFTNQRYQYKGCVDEVERRKDRVKSQVRSKVGHGFAVLKVKFGLVKVRYKALAKNTQRLFVTHALAKLYLLRGKLRCPAGA